MHFSSLPSGTGIGDIGDAAHAFLQQIGKMGLKVWQFLPTGPTAYGDSPYQPLSAFAGNEMLIGLEPLVRAGLLEQDELLPLQGLDPTSVDFGKLIPMKAGLLARAAACFDRSASSELKSKFDGFLRENQQSWLENYALYRILKTLHDEKPWPEWEAVFVRRDRQALNRIGEQYREQLRNLQIVQFFYDQQWEQLVSAAEASQVRLFGDMPIYIALDSADAWASPQMLRISQDGVPSHVAGVPPDYFSNDGQLWGNPLYDWEAHARDGYSWWIARMRHACSQSHLVRVDHFRGFESYWSVPFGQATARNGAWEAGPGDALFLAMKASLPDMNMVAENLGVITPKVEALRLRHQVPGMVVLQFEVNNPDFDPANVPVQSVCYTGTHDNDTSAGWFHGSPIDLRSAEETAMTRNNTLRLTGGNADDFPASFVRLAFSSSAQLAIAPMQDYLGLGSGGRMNIPGTTMNNWRWRMPDGALNDGRLESIRRQVSDSGRG